MIPTPIHKKATVLIVGTAPIVKPQPVVIKAPDYSLAGRSMDPLKVRNGALARQTIKRPEFSF